LLKLKKFLSKQNFWKGVKMDDKEKIIEILKRVKDPETGVDIVTLGLIYGFTIDENITEIWVDFQGNTPDCNFCKTIAWSIIEKISNDIMEEFKKEGYKNIKVVEALNPSIYYKSST
jgi:metal-sulfur cluster biosynthetic enzyme